MLKVPEIGRFAVTLPPDAQDRNACGSLCVGALADGLCSDVTVGVEVSVVWTELRSV